MAVITVANIDIRSTEANVRSAFEVYGNVVKVNLSWGWAFVEMADEAAAARAVSDLNNHTAWVLRTAA